MTAEEKRIPTVYCAISFHWTLPSLYRLLVLWSAVQLLFLSLRQILLCKNLIAVKTINLPWIYPEARPAKSFSLSLLHGYHTGAKTNETFTILDDLHWTVIVHQVFAAPNDCLSPKKATWLPGSHSSCKFIPLFSSRSVIHKIMAVQWKSICMQALRTKLAGYPSVIKLHFWDPEYVLRVDLEN